MIILLETNNVILSKPSHRIGYTSTVPSILQQDLTVVIKIYDSIDRYKPQWSRCHFKNPSPRQSRRHSRTSSPRRSRRHIRSPSPRRSRRHSRSPSPRRSRRHIRSPSPRRDRRYTKSPSPSPLYYCRVCRRHYPQELSKRSPSVCPGKYSHYLTLW